MKIALVKTEDSHFIPAYDSDLDKSKKIAVGEIRTYESKKDRNLGHHRKLWALYRLALANIPENKQEEAFNFGFQFKTKNDVAWYVKVKLGYIRNRMILKNGNIVYEVDSISFERMDQDEFQDFYDKAIDVIIDLIGADKEMIENELINFM